MAKKSSGGKETFVVQSKLKGLVKKNKMKCSSDVVGAVNKLISTHIGKACERAKANGRRTVRGADL
jgi:hypothetical protein